ncbi:MAG: hypothetical protein ACERKD_17155 [Prolixibacteraceae bacterium]
MKTRNNFKNNVKSLLAIVFVSIFMITTSNVVAQNSNFSGTWTFNESKSKAEDMGFRRAASKITVTQDDLALTAERVSKGRDGEDRIRKEKVTLDGKECENVIFQDRKRKSVATWSADGKELTIKSSMTFDMGGESREFKSLEVWKLSDDKKVLSIESTFDGRDGEVKATMVYDSAK